MLCLENQLLQDPPLKHPRLSSGRRKLYEPQVIDILLLVLQFGPPKCLKQDVLRQHEEKVAGDPRPLRWAALLLWRSEEIH